MFWLFLPTAMLAAYLVYQNYQLEKRWRCLRYCWLTMSDFAGEALRSPDGDIDANWEDVAREHLGFMRQFGIQALTEAERNLYEAALLERNMFRWWLISSSTAGDGLPADNYGSGHSLYRLVEGMKLYRVPGP